jgi:outer membrane protein
MDKPAMRKSTFTTLLLSATLLTPATVSASDLLDVYQLSLKNDPRLSAVHAQYNAAIEVKPQARALVLPLVSAVGNVDRNRDKIIDTNTAAFTPGTTHYNSKSYGLSLNQTLFDWGVFSQLRQADASVAAAQAQLTAAEQDQIVRVADRYFDVLAANDDLRTAQAEKTSIASQLDRSRKRFEVGFSPVLDVQEAQARYDLTVAQEINAQRLLRSAREALREVTGRLPDTLAGLQVEIPLEGPQPLDSEQWVQTASTQNLDLVGRRIQADIAKEDIKQQTGGHYPSLSLVGSYGYSDQLQAPFGREEETGAIGLQLAVPLYAGGAVQSRVKQAQYTYEQRLAELDQSQRQVAHSTRDAYDGVVAGISQVQALGQAVKSNQAALDTTEAGFRVGTRTAVDTLDARSALYRAERDYARSRYDYLLNVLRLKQAAGQLNVEDLKKVNQLLKVADSAPAAATQPSGVTLPAPGYPPGVTVAPEPAIKMPYPGDAPASTKDASTKDPATKDTAPPAATPAPARPDSAQ